MLSVVGVGKPTANTQWLATPPHTVSRDGHVEIFIVSDPAPLNHVAIDELVVQQRPASHNVAQATAFAMFGRRGSSLPDVVFDASTACT